MPSYNMPSGQQPTLLAVESGTNGFQKKKVGSKKSTGVYLFTSGASILTFCELVDYLMIRCADRCGRNKRTDVTEFDSQAQLEPK